MDNLPDDVIIKHVIALKTDQDRIQFCSSNKRIFDICKRNKNHIYNEIFKEEYEKDPRLFYQTLKNIEPDCKSLAWVKLQPNWVDFNGSTCLIKAIKDNNVELAKKLIAIKNYYEDNEWKPISVINKQDRSGRTALMYATGSKFTEIVKLLLQAGAKIDIQDIDGDTALVFASNTGNIEITELLLQAGAKVNIQDVTGSTALIIASDQGHTEIVKLLLKFGAKTTFRDNGGNTALSLARRGGRTEIVKLLLKHKMKLFY
jgi:ankyrin repeat protein